jgi:hypothetical protein
MPVGQALPLGDDPDHFGVGEEVNGNEVGGGPDAIRASWIAPFSVVN